MSDTIPADPTGLRFRIESDGVSAEIAEVGASLRALNVDGVDVVPRYPDGTSAPAASGTVLVPWPNRVAGGAWSQRGTSYQLAITEPATGNAIHGLLRFAPYRAVQQSPDAITLAATVFPQTGYPFHLETSVTYAVGDRSVTVTHDVRNVGAADAPVALGAHPYLMIAGVPTGELALHLAADSAFAVDDRMIPVGVKPVDAANDLRGSRRVADLSLDTAFAGIRRDLDGRIRANLHAPDGRRVELWAGPGFGYLQVFTTDRYPGQPVAVAVEPMTAPADAFNSGQDLHWLQPGESWAPQWGIILHP